MKISFLITIYIFELMLISIYADQVADFPDSITNIKDAELKYPFINEHTEGMITNIAARIPPAFIENRGQIENESMKYYLKSSGKIIYLTETGIVMDLYHNVFDTNKQNNDPPDTDFLQVSIKNRMRSMSSRRQGVVIKMTFPDAKPFDIRGVNPLPG